MAPNALVTGTSGFVAGHLARRLLADGYDVTGVDLKSPRSDLGDALRQVTLDIREKANPQRIKAVVDEAPRGDHAEAEGDATEVQRRLRALVDDGYPSIGCAPCTRRVAPGEDVRSGRWAGTNKTECGIHVN